MNSIEIYRQTLKFIKHNYKNTYFTYLKNADWFWCRNFCVLLYYTNGQYTES